MYRLFLSLFRLSFAPLSKFSQSDFLVADSFYFLFQVTPSIHSAHWAPPDIIRMLREVNGVLEQTGEFIGSFNVCPYRSTYASDANKFVLGCPKFFSAAVTASGYKFKFLGCRCP
ncbi:hypothetical protein GGU10DRAFT_366286 [Lentinula aff. detonsa]|uniref:Uncharacterized protein n=1 Tax=Lentinula aff. detonsa TaxID=2804958 RepID=A0AA38KDW0_9AGAR|nr:hypothetical protein GGU10DRAFT_366286 [Lentinula aff. detonsa]